MVPIQADEEGGAGKFLRNPAGDDAHNTLVPALVRQNDGLRRGALGQHGNGLPIDFRFNLLPLPVQLAQLGGDGTGLFRVPGQKQVYSQLHLAHASGGVDPGGKHIADGGGGDFCLGTAAFLHQGGKAGAAGMAQVPEAPGDKHPVFPHQGDDIGHRAQAHHVGVLLQHGLRVAGQGTAELKGHGHTGEILVGVAVVGPVGVHNGGGPGKLVLALVVVRNHQVQPQLPAQLRLLYGGDAAVHGDNELDPFALQLPDGDGVQAVALLQPPGDVAQTVGPLPTQKVCQKAGGGDAVHVVVAEDRNPLLVFKGLPHPGHGLVHIPQKEGVWQGTVTA